MGLKTIQAKYADARRAHEATLGKFVKDALEVNKLLAEIQKKKAASDALSREVGELFFDTHKTLEKLDPLGIKQLADVFCLRGRPVIIRSPEFDDFIAHLCNFGNSSWQVQPVLRPYGIELKTYWNLSRLPETGQRACQRKRGGRCC